MKRYISADSLNLSGLQIIDYWDDFGDRYFTVDLGNNYRAAVKFPRVLENCDSTNIDYDNQYSYIMDCEGYGDDLNILFDEWNKDNNPPELELTNSEYIAILDFVDKNAADFVATHQ